MGDIETVSRDMHLRDLEVFVAASHCRSFREAASRLYTSQPAVTRSISRLESALGVSLFHRSTGGVSLTSAGETLLVKARQVVHLLSDIRSEPLQTTTRTIRLGTAATAAGSFLAPFLAKWIPEHPHTRLHVLEDGAARLSRRLWEGEVDLAIVASPLPSVLDGDPITRVGISAHFPEGHPLDNRSGGLTVADLAPFPLLLNQPTFISAQVITAEFERAKIRPNIVYQSAIGQTLGSLAEAGMGVALFSESVDLRSTTLSRRPVMDAEHKQLEFHLQIAWRKDDTRPEIKAFAGELSTFVTTHWAPFGEPEEQDFRNR